MMSLVFDCCVEEPLPTRGLFQLGMLNHHAHHVACRAAGQSGDGSHIFMVCQDVQWNVFMANKIAPEQQCNNMVPTGKECWSRMHNVLHAQSCTCIMSELSCIPAAKLPLATSQDGTCSRQNDHHVLPYKNCVGNQVTAGVKM